MIALLAAAALALTPAAVVAKYEAAIAAVSEPRVFTVEYALEQTGTRTLEQTHRIFRSGGDERDEIIAVNGTKTTKPTVRIFRGRPYRYTVAHLAPKPSAYGFTFIGPRKSGRHSDYVFRLTPKTPANSFTFTDVTIDGVTFLPDAVSFATREHEGHGSVTFAKSERWWVATGASASARVPSGTAHERLVFTNWRFPKSLPPSTFAAARPLLKPSAPTP